MFSIIQMFNPAAEVFVIFYPHGAGGRFLQSIMALDPSIKSVYLDSHKELHRKQTFTELKEYLSQNNDSHVTFGHLREYDTDQMPWANRYVFCVHQIEYGSAIEFLKLCGNLKIINITIESPMSNNLIDARRKYLGRNIPDESIRSSYRIHYGEVAELREFPKFLKDNLYADPVVTLDVAQYWNPEIAVLILNNFFTEHGIDCKNWEELYHLWLTNSISVWQK